MNYKNLMILMYSIILCFNSNLMSWGDTKQYNNVTLNTAWAAIQQKAIKVSSNEVAQRAGTETDVVESFKEEFLTDAAQDAPISEKRKRQRGMTLVRKVHNGEEVYELKLEVNEFVEDVALEFQNKEEVLEKEIQGLFGKKIGYGSAIVLGMILAGVAWQTRDPQMQKIIGGVGCLSLGGGGIGLYSVRGAERILRMHQEQTKIMKNDWEAAFKPNLP